MRDLRLREGLDRGEWPGAESNCRHADFQAAALPTELPGRAMQQKNLAGCMIGWEWRRAMAWGSFSRNEDHEPAPTVCLTPLDVSTQRRCARGSRDGSAGRAVRSRSQDRKSTRLNSSH